MMPLTMRRSSSRSGPVNPLGRCGSIRAHCLSFSQNKPARILSPPNQHVGKRITRRYLGTDPSRDISEPPNKRGNIRVWDRSEMSALLGLSRETFAHAVDGIVTT